MSEVESKETSAGFVVNNDALGSAMTNLLNAFHGSGHGGVDYMVSARLRGCERCSTLGTMLGRALAIPIAVGVEQRRSADDIVVEFIQNFTKIPLDEAAHRELVRIIEAERV